MAKTKYVNLKNYKSIRDGSFRKALFAKLGDELYNIKDPNFLLFTALKAIYPVNRGLTQSQDSIEKKVYAVLKHFRLNNIPKAQIFSINDDGSSSALPPSKEMTKIEEFWHYILQIDEPPAIAFHEIKNDVEADLKEISELIKCYESDPFIKKLNDEGVRPRNHEQKILHDFYKRCLNEQKVILEYYLDGLKKRALAVASNFYDPLKSNKYWRSLKDRPYFFARYFSRPYFDCRKIDLLGHRIGDYGISSLKELRLLYKNNKPKFYRTLFKKHTIAQIFLDVDFYLGQLPLINNRHSIFAELKSLFKAKRWIGFYSLALTQIEGLFTEMYLTVNPELESNMKSLPDKVESIRPFHDLSHVYFDYYQYHIPRLRNKFMHSGFDEDFKLKSFDLLWDLYYLLKIFFELNDPLVKITQLHTRRNYEDFISYVEYSGYFQLLDRILLKKKSELKEVIDSFEKDFLVRDCNAEYVCMEVIQNSPQPIKILADKIQEHLTRFGITTPLEKLKKKEIETLCQNEKIADKIADSFLFNMRETEEVRHFYYFFKGYKMYLPSIGEGYYKALQTHFASHGQALSNVFFFYQALEKKVKP